MDHPSCQANLANVKNIKTNKIATGIPITMANNILKINRIITLKTKKDERRLQFL